MKKISMILAVIMTVACFIAAGPAEAAAASDKADVSGIKEGVNCASGELIVVYNKSVGISTAASKAESMTGGDAKSVFSTKSGKKAAVVKLPKGETVAEAVEAYSGVSGVAYVQPNYVYKADASSSLSDTYVQNGSEWYLDKVNATEAWDLLAAGSASKVKVAVLDTGAYFGHEDFGANMDEALSVDVTGDAVNGQYPSISGDGGVKVSSSMLYHGTHVCGIIGATANNTKGTAGVAAGYNNDLVDIMAVDVFTDSIGNRDGGAYTDDIVKGITYAVSKGAKVVNMSLGGSSDLVNDGLFNEAITSATNSGTLCVAAAGNENTDSHYMPSDATDALSVIALENFSDTSANSKADFSNFGSVKDISAPGVSIVSEYYGSGTGSYANMNGTSMATPIVTAVAAMVYAAYPSLTVAEVKDILCNTATDLYTTGFDDQTANGIVNAEAAVGEALAYVSSGNTAVDAVMADIRSIGAVTLSDKAAIEKARAGYAALSEAEKILVKNYTTLNTAITKYNALYADINAVISKINAIGSVTLSSSSAITAAKNAYEALTEEQKSYVTNYSTLTAAESAYAAIIAANTTPEAPYSISGSTNGTLAVNLTWSAVSGADGYVVSRYDEQGGNNYVADTANTSYTDSTILSGVTYWYCVCSYKQTASKTLFSGWTGWIKFTVTAYSAPVENTITVKAPAVKKLYAKSGAKGKITLKWAKSSGAKGYYVYRSTTKNGKYKLVKKLTGKTTWTNSKLKSGKKYYYKYRAYKIAGGKALWSKYSSAVYAKVK